MKRQPGYISTQLHRGIAGSTVLMNYAVWESVAQFRAAFNHPEFEAALDQYPSSAIASPHLFTRLSVPNSASAEKQGLTKLTSFFANASDDLSKG